MISSGWVQNVLYFFFSIAPALFGGGILWARSISSNKRHEESTKRHDESEESRGRIFARLDRIRSECIDMIQTVRKDSDEKINGLTVSLYKGFPRNEDMKELKRDILTAIKEIECRIEKRLEGAMCFKKQSEN